MHVCESDPVKHIAICQSKIHIERTVVFCMQSFYLCNRELIDARRCKYGKCNELLLCALPFTYRYITRQNNRNTISKLRLIWRPPLKRYKIITKIFFCSCLLIRVSFKINNTSSITDVSRLR